jgi:hypothetical protein
VVWAFRFAAKDNHKTSCAQMSKPIILDLMSEGIWNGIKITKNFISQIHNATKNRQYQNDKFPFVKGHPKDDDPAYGWGEKENIFIDANGHLKIKTSEENFQPEFLEQLKKKEYGPVSIKLRPEDLSIKHIGFFGAVPTAVTNLEPAFSEIDKTRKDEVELLFKKCDMVETDSEITLAFSEMEISRYQLSSATTIFRNIKNYFIETLGLEKADTILPETLLENISEPLKIYNDNSFKEKPILPKNNREDNMALTEQEIADLQKKAKLADDLAAENKTLKDNLQFNEQEKKFNTAFQFCESDDIKKKLTPALQTRVAHLISSLDNDESVLEFKEDKKDVKVNSIDVIKELIGLLPVLDFSEFAKNGKGEEKPDDKAFKEGEEAAKRLNA